MLKEFRRKKIRFFKRKVRFHPFINRLFRRALSGEFIKDFRGFLNDDWIEGWKKQFDWPKISRPCLTLQNFCTTHSFALVRSIHLWRRKNVNPFSKHVIVAFALSIIMHDVLYVASAFFSFFLWTNLNFAELSRAAFTTFSAEQKEKRELENLSWPLTAQNRIFFIRLNENNQAEVGDCLDSRLVEELIRGWC